MASDTLFVVEPGDNRQAQIESLDLGETVSITRRIGSDMGINRDQIAQHFHQLRGTLDQQVKRAKRKVPGGKFIVENGSFITYSGAIMLSAVCTRIA